MNKAFQDALIKLAYKLPMLPRRQLLFAVHQGRWARLRNPQLMTEKVNWRVLFDRRDVLSWTCDKLRMKEETQKLCPELKVPKTLWHGTDVSDLLKVDLPEHWVLKPNHRSSVIHFGHGSVQDLEELREITEGWLEEENFRFNGEWAYGQAERTIFAEEALGQPGVPPDDYKFYVFDGVTRLIQVDRGRFNEGHSRRHYSADWKPIELAVSLPEGDPAPPPADLNRMLSMASAVGQPFDFMRVDLYNIDGDIYLGEVTPYPASGHGRYEPREVDQLMGTYWTLPKL